MHIDALDTTYTRLDDPEAYDLIEDRLNGLFVQVDSQVQTSTDKIKVSVFFYERRPKKFWFAKAEEEVCWEEWDVAVTFTQALTEQVQLQVHAQLVKSLNSCLMKISHAANEKKDHIPPMLTSDPFPYQIVLSLQPNTFWNTITKMIPTS
ncbi:hypothetical protein BSLG_008368 [Batrachochytrium salamandrivorans]|nr:hypothetical protein BSLG_008368 [Batrachochytrium salamandrivorans]